MSYLESLKRQQNPTRNMKGVPVEVKTDIGKAEDDVDPIFESMVRQRLMSMDPKKLKRLEKQYRMMSAGAKSQGDKEQKLFDRRAKEAGKRNQQIMKDKEEQLTAMKRKEIAEEKEIARKAEREADKIASKAERVAEKQDAIYLDFPKLDLDESTYETSRSIIDGKMATLENKYSKKMELQSDGSKKLNNFDQKEFDNEKAELEAEQSQLDNKYYSTREYKLRLLFRDANRKYPGNPQKVYDVFANEGYEQEYIKYARELQSKQGSNK